MLRFSILGLITGAAAMAASTATNAPVTFSKDVAPIFQAKCEECHRKGTPAPMSLVTYQEARPWAKAIKERVLARQMPPWHIDKTIGIQQFQNDRSLSDAQINTIVRWVDAGAPLGDPKDLPAPLQWPTEETWQLAKKYGQPDLIVKSEPYTMPARGQDVWWRPRTTNIPLTEPRWVRAVEMRPGTPAGRKITHHALAHVQQEEPGASADDNDVNNIGMGPTLMEWAIGKQYDDFRAGTGKLLVPGVNIQWDIHLHAVGEQITDGLELGIYLYPKGQEPKYRTRLVGFQSIPRAAGGTLDIPPNSIAETQSFTVLKEPARFENYQPHMHLRGKAMLLEAILPDGTTQVINYVDHFNFNWMNNYIYTDEAAPVFPKGTIIRTTAWYDNTTANPNNPDPNQWVGSGDRTVDEMGHAWVNVTNISEADYKAWAETHRAKKPARATTGGR